jgi:hypothetical protein
MQRVCVLGIPRSLLPFRLFTMLYDLRIARPHNLSAGGEFSTKALTFTLRCGRLGFQMTQ